MNISKNFQGALILSTIVKGQRIERTYMGYTQREAKALFRKEVKKEKERCNSERYFAQLAK